MRQLNSLDIFFFIIQGEVMSQLKANLQTVKELIKNKEFNYFVTKYGYKILTRHKNKTLFSLLEKVGFFNFHITNRKKVMVGLHQVVLYIYKGYKAYHLKGIAPKGAIEVHHIDHNPSNNSVTNLEYTTPANNKAIATICSKCCKSNCGYYNSSIKFDLDAVRLHHNVPFIKLLAKSLIATGKQIRKDLMKQFLLSLPFKQSKLIYNSLVKELNYA